MARIFVISGPSGCGKSTLCGNLLRNDDKIRFSVSATTRKPRIGEVDGVNYFYLSREEFDEKIKEGAFYEHAEVFGNKYGTLVEYTDGLTEAGYDVILDIDVQGAKQVRAKNEKAVLIFIMPPSFEELKKRLTDRRTESAEDLNKRLSLAEEEASHRGEYDYVIVNERLDEAYIQLRNIILKYREDDKKDS